MKHMMKEMNGKKMGPGMKIMKEPPMGKKVGKPKKKKGK